MVISPEFGLIVKSPFPAVIAYVRSATSVSASVATTVPTISPIAANSEISKVCANTTGGCAAITSSVMVTVHSCSVVSSSAVTV